MFRYKNRWLIGEAGEAGNRPGGESILGPSSSIDHVGTEIRWECGVCMKVWMEVSDVEIGRYGRRYT